METMNKLADPLEAKAYFEDKMNFTTGPVELNHLIHSGDNHITIVDVRAAEDYDKGHIPGAINLPNGTWETAEGLTKEKTNIVYCYSQVCHLGAKACVEFAGRGFPVMEMDGGFEAWRENDLEVDHAHPNRLSKMGEKLFGKE
jgi:rhodanese-related sulfurtransferase